MDVRNWPLGQIMQLPDYCFGRRWPVITSRRILPDATDQWLITVGLPDAFVLWAVRLWFYPPAIGTAWFKFALGDHEPADVAAFDAFEPLFPGDFENVIVPAAMYIPHYQPAGFECRMPVQVQGRRFAVQVFNGHATNILTFTAVFEVSSIPTEVPDCLLSV